jgi:hypothetical protein
VSGYFTVTLISVLCGGSLFVGELIRHRIPIEQLPSFAAQHPMAYLLACGAVILAGLLAVGDV